MHLMSNLLGTKWRQSDQMGTVRSRPVVARNAEPVADRHRRGSTVPRWQPGTWMITMCAAGLLIGHMGPSVRGADDEVVSFNQQIRPILSDRCFHCHGPNETDRQGGFRLDDRDSAVGEADSGEHPIVPGDPQSSGVYQRLTETDVDMRMPPAETNKTVTAEEIATIRKWIEQGAPWQRHWAYERPCRPPLPTVRQADWSRNEIDRFVLARLEKRGWSPAPEADKVTLLRRVTLDLTGLPPTGAQVEQFVADPDPAAYEKVVDRLLQSPRYGEHMARYWLDAARYGDTHGLHLDNYREMWPYRDWVVRAFNDNLPFDQFTIEQLAGDLLPNPTDDQLVATGFNRCHVTTAEGGSITEEVHVRNVVDRVDTVGTVFLGATFECTRCHDHKYDPFTQQDFYSLFAYFNSIDGDPLDGNRQDPAPVLRVLNDTQKQQIADLRKQQDEIRNQIRTELAAITYQEPADPATGKTTEQVEQVWFDDALPEGAKAEGDWKWVTAPQPVYRGERASTRTATGLSQHFFTGATNPLSIAPDQILFAYVYLDPGNPPQEIMMQFNDGSWEHRAYWGGNHIDWGQDGQASRKSQGDLPPAGQWVRLEVAADQVGLQPGAKLNGWALTQFDGTVYWDQAGIVTRQVTYTSLAEWDRDQRAAGAAGLPDPIQKTVKKEPDQRSDDEQRQLREYFLQHVYAPARATFAGLQTQLDDTGTQVTKIESGAPTTLIYRERKEPRQAHVLNRGEYDQPKDEVQRRLPTALSPQPDEQPRDRLGLARWLVSPQHPLTARVTVNRFWQQLFGTGLVKTAEDFGSQGEVPSHPQLLDWLAVQFVEDGWDVKQTMKRMVLSATYRQTSHVPPEQYRRDPENRWLAHGPRFRLDAEVLRDQALAVSGLLVEQLGGPSVKPPQPDGLWFAVGYSGSNTVRFTADQGPEKVHRRTLYTFIKRTSPPPQLSTFDAPSRESCTVRRERTNTPLQALLLMNDPQYVECARALAERVLREAGGEVPQRASHMFQLAAGHRPTDATLSELGGTFQDFLTSYQQNEAAARQLIEIGDWKPAADVNVAELAAWTVVGNLILNLDEVTTKN